MAYEIYKKPVSKSEYFEKWEDERMSTLTDTMKDELYNKYLVKCEVFSRDGFKCQNIDCKNPFEKLTMHHIKFQKNGGEHKPKNCITLCHSCHKGFHSGKHPLVFSDGDYLPSAIRGHTFQLDKTFEVNWKVIKREMKKFRKTLYDEHGQNISWEHLAMLLRWLEIVHDEEYDD